MSAIEWVMTSSKRIDRKLFLTWGLTSTSLWAVGCGDDAVNVSGTGGSGGSGTAGSASSGAAGAPGGTSAGGTSAGNAGTSNAGSTSNTGSAGSAGAGGSSAVAPSCNTQLATLISANHGHVFLITAADVMAAVPKPYATKGTSPHEHWVQLTAADFAKLQTGGTVRKVSCNDGHEHEFIVNCLGIAMPETTSGVANFCDTEHQCGDVETNICPLIP